jgi:hypothetical protein
VEEGNRGCPRRGQGGGLAGKSKLPWIDFIADNELPPLLNAAEKEGLVILWVYLSSCLYDETEIRDYQAAHDIAKPLDSLTPAKQNAILVDVCRKIEATANPVGLSPALLEFTMIRLSRPTSQRAANRGRRSANASSGEITNSVQIQYLRFWCETGVVPPSRFTRVGIRLLQRIAERGSTMGESRILKVKAKYSVPCPEEWKEMWGDINDRSEKAIDAVEMEGDSSYVFTLTLKNSCDPNSASRSEVRFYL